MRRPFDKVFVECVFLNLASSSAAIRHFPPERVGFYRRRPTVPEGEVVKSTKKRSKVGEKQGISTERAGAERVPVRCGSRRMRGSNGLCPPWKARGLTKKKS